MERKILEVLKYFSRFNYSPTLDEIFTFLAQKTTKKSLKKRIETLVKDKKLLKNGKKYTLWEYSEINRWSKEKFLWSKEKKAKAAFFVKLVSFFPQIRLIGFSGSLAMMNASKNDDIDAFIITKKNRLWTARLISLLVASILGKRRKFGEPHADDKICLNLFFDEAGLSIAAKKRSYFVAHEVLQMKPVVNKEDTYSRFLEANKWVLDIFPNARNMVDNSSFFRDQSRSYTDNHRSSNDRLKKSKLSPLGDFMEFFLKKLQLYLIRKHQTSEIITDTQLWFFPDDFEKKIRQLAGK